MHILLGIGERRPFITLIVCGGCVGEGTSPLLCTSLLDHVVLVASFGTLLICGGYVGEGATILFPYWNFCDIRPLVLCSCVAVMLEGVPILQFVRRHHTEYIGIILQPFVTSFFLSEDIRISSKLIPEMFCKI